jgi:hypothetical protein
MCIVLLEQFMNGWKIIYQVGQKVKLSDQESSEIRVTNGVPQGS